VCVVWTLAVFKALLLSRAFLVCFVAKILLPDRCLPRTRVSVLISCCFRV
jgi:hypothetical protein